MKIDEAVSRQRRANPSVKERVQGYIEAHSDEVFTYRDEDLLGAVGASRAALGFALWSLRKDGAIEKLEHDGRAFFGTAAAIREMKRRLEKQDPWERARQNMERIRSRAGNIDLLELLDEVRGSGDN